MEWRDDDADRVLATNYVGGLCGTTVVVVEATKYRNSLDAALQLRRPRNGLPLVETLVRTGLVVEAHKFGDESAEMPFANNQNMVEQLTSQGFHEALGECVHVGCTDGAAHDASTGCRENPMKDRAELRIVIADQYLRRPPIERDVARLLRATRVRRSVRYRCVNNHSTFQINEEENEDLTKKRIIGLHEVDSPCDVVAKKR